MDRLFIIQKKVTEQDMNRFLHQLEYRILYYVVRILNQDSDINNNFTEILWKCMRLYALFLHVHKMLTSKKLKIRTKSVTIFRIGIAY